MSMWIASILAALSVAALPAASLAQNVLPNADFDTDLSGWDTTADTSWSPLDSDASPSSGSLQIVVTELKSTAITVCVPVVGGETYEFGVDILIETQGTAEGRAGIVVRWEADAACTQELPDFPANTFRTSAPEWTNATLTATAPDEAVAALVELRATKSGGGSGSTITAHFDDANFQPLSSPACADPVAPFNKITSGDALFVLRASVQSVECNECHCNVNGTGGTTASDALVALRAAVSLEVTLACPACS